MTSPVLLDALDQLRGTGPEYDGFGANHGPMASDALIRLGHGEAVVGWLDRYRTRLSPAIDGGAGISAVDWREHLGDPRLLGAWRELMQREVRAGPWLDVLARWWPRLLPGLAASATHGVIRTAHAVRALGDAAAPNEEVLLLDELAEGLALWAGRYQLLPGDPKLRGRWPAVAAVRELPRLPGDVPSAGPGISGRLSALVRLGEFPAALQGWSAPADSHTALDDLIGAAARVLAARPDAPIAFCHAVTAPAAIRMVLPALPGALHEPTVAASWQVVGAIVSAYAEPRLDSERERLDRDPAPLLAELADRAVEHGDEHVIKLTEAVLREFPRTGDTTLLVAADLFRGRVQQ